jgi:hypothetical protein
MKLFCISDIHSFYKPMIKALSDAGYDESNPDHKLIICGDIFDRGPNSWATYLFITKLVREGKAIYIRGNHESLLEDLVYRGYPKEIDGNDSNCTLGTVCQLVSADKTSCPDTLDISFADACQSCKQIVKWINENSIFYYEIGRYIFVHSWIPTLNLDGKPFYYTRNRKFGFMKDWRNASPQDWFEASWGNPINMYCAGLYEPNKTIVCGHWHTSGFHNRLELHKNDLWDFQPGANFGIFRSDDNILVAIDACTAFTEQTNVLVINDVDKTPNDPINLTKDSTKEVFGKYER